MKKLLAVFLFLSISDNADAVLIPLVDISPNLKAAYEKAIELINKGKTSANNLEVEHIIDGKSIKGKLTEILENGQNVIDENGNKLALLEVNGEKIPVLIAEDGTTSKLAQSADEVVDDASKALVKVQGAGDISSTLSKITNLTAVEKATLKTLLEADADLAKAFAKAPEEMSGAWKLVRNSIAEGTQFAKDPKTLEKLAEMMQSNSAFRQKLGSSWEQELKDILEKNSDLRCGTCGNKGFANLPTMDEVLDNLANISRFSHKPGFSSVLKNLKSNVANRDGVNHMIGYIKKNADEFENITEFEFQYADEFLNKADVLVGNIKYEFKSWTPDIPNSWNSFFSGTGNSYTQFLRYLQNTTDVKNIKYIFNGAKASESKVKTAFKALLTNKKPEIFNAMKPELKTALKIDGIDGQIKFNQLIENLDSDLYKFIKAQ